MTSLAGVVTATRHVRRHLACTSPRPRRTPARRTRDESGASAVELVMYMPLLMITILLAVQFSLVYLGGQVASGAAREAARTARVTQNQSAAVGVAQRMVDQIGAGVLDDSRIQVDIGAETARATVSGNASYILPFLPIPRVSETVSGPVERFVQDTGAGATP